MFNTLFSFCELSYACAKCFSSGPLVFPGPIFMNHREQALARIRPHPAQLKHKRDKHKGIWSSLLARVEKADTSTLPLSCTQSLFSKKCTKWLLPFFLLVFCYLRRKRTHFYVDLFFFFFKLWMFGSLHLCFPFLFLFFYWKKCCFSGSSLISEATSFLKFLEFAVGNFNTFPCLNYHIRTVVGIFCFWTCVV